VRQVGVRRELAVAEKATGLLVAEGARFNEAVSRLSRTMFVPKGVYRFASHDEANRHGQDCLVRGMDLLAAARA
jgi:hypothetical protein